MPHHLGFFTIKKMVKISKRTTFVYNNPILKYMIKVTCTNNQKTETVKAGSSLLEIFNYIDCDLKYRPLCATINNKAKSLNTKLYDNVDIHYFDITSAIGKKTYLLGLFFILSKVIEELYPNGKVEMANSISKGTYCPVHIGRALTEDDILAINRRTQEIIDSAIPFVRHREHTDVVIEMMEQKGRTDLVRLLKTTGKIYTTYYTLEDNADFFFGTLPPDTSFIHLYGIELYGNGVLLRFPDSKNPSQLRERTVQDKMFKIFDEFHSWQKILGISTLGDLNLATSTGHSNMIINIAEALQSNKIVHIADAIVERHKKNNSLKLIMISGPSSSGKTTFSKRLQVQLLANGINPKVLSMDDYFLGRERTPKDENGDYDFESLYAIDLELFNSQLKDLLAGKEVNTPTFNFKKGGVREYNGNILKLGENDVLLIEGIHALNPDLMPEIPAEAKFLIYVSALTSIRLDKHNYIPTTDNRLLRRMLRDYKYRQFSAKDTIARWASVRAGEEKWIFPYQENADVMFNSATLFEIAVIKDMIEPILSEVPQNCPEYTKAEELKKLLSMFNTIPSQNLPPTSLVREFIGGSSFHY